MTKDAENKINEIEDDDKSKNVKSSVTEENAA